MSTIIFDVGNVIIKADDAITHRILSGYGVPRDRVKTFFENDEYKEFSRGNINGEEFYRALINRYLRFRLTYTQVVHAHNEHMYGVDSDVVDVIKKLLPNHRIVFLTDTNEWQTERERELIDLRNYSDFIFRSNEMHMLKSDDGTFPYVLAQLKVDPNEVLVVDDSPEKIRKASHYGLNTLQFKSSKQLTTALDF